MSNIFFCDVETTGLNPYTNAIIEIAYIIEVNDQVVLERVYQMRPMDGKVIDPAAMAIHKIDLSNPALLEPAYVFNKMRADIEKYQRLDFCGFRTNFDWDFFDQFWKSISGEKITNAFTGHVLDPRSLLHHMDQWGLIALENYKLTSCCAAYDIPLLNAHSALADIQATRDLYHKLKKFWLTGIPNTENFDGGSMKESLQDYDFSDLEAKHFDNTCALCPANCVCGDDHVCGGIACDNFHKAMGKKIADREKSKTFTISKFMNRCREEFEEMKSPLKGMKTPITDVHDSLLHEQEKDIRSLYDRTDAINQRLDAMQEQMNKALKDQKQG
jgi:DNA polymerase-3 subunit epsilon